MLPEIPLVPLIYILQMRVACTWTSYELVELEHFWKQYQRTSNEEAWGLGHFAMDTSLHELAVWPWLGTSQTCRYISLPAREGIWQWFAKSFQWFCYKVEKGTYSHWKETYWAEERPRGLVFMLERGKEEDRRAPNSPHSRGEGALCSKQTLFEILHFILPWEWYILRHSLSRFLKCKIIFH